MSRSRLILSTTIALVIASMLAINAFPEALSSGLIPLLIVGGTISLVLLLGFFWAFRRSRAATLALACVFVTISMALIYRPVQRSVAATRLEESGVIIRFNNEGTPNGRWFTWGPLLLPAVLQEHLGPGFFREIEYLTIDGSQIEPEQLVGITFPKRVSKRITFRDCDLTSPIFLQFANECDTPMVVVWSSNVGDAVLDALAEMDSIRTIRIVDSNLSKSQAQAFADRTLTVDVEHGTSWKGWAGVVPSE